MKKLLLTSGGLTDNLKELFWKTINKAPSDTKILFIPSAATESDGAREGISMCIYKLMEMGIRSQNIFTYNLKFLLSKGYRRTYSTEVSHLPKEFRLLTAEELKEFDAVICGSGNAALLVEELNRTGFDTILQQAVKEGLLYIGISAGSMAAAGNFAAGLHFIENPLTVHCEQGTTCGEIKGDGHIRLTDEQAIWIEDSCSHVIA
ncbi:MAG: Type 1 glutamine amidotransferase-like domain-containing protein [Hydrogeniiclostridium sp.]